jgi:phage baseplate assembly protein W
MSQSHLGQGLSFPFRFSRQTGGAELSAVTTREHEHIRESIRQILGTKLGERFMRPDFGFRLHTLIFEPNAEVLKGLLRYHVTDALKRWERRIIVLNVTLDNSDFNKDRNFIGVNIRYRLISSQSESNYVYPFVREGGPA